MPSCACDDFTRDFIPSSDEAARPVTWRPLSVAPGIRLSSTVECFRGPHLVLAFCTECRRTWYLSWDQQNDTFAAVPLDETVLDVLSLNCSIDRVAEYLRSDAYRAWGYALGQFIDRYLFEATYDRERAIELFEGAQRAPALAAHVVGSIAVRIERVKRRQLEDTIERRKREKANRRKG